MPCFAWQTNSQFSSGNACVPFPLISNIPLSLTSIMCIFSLSGMTHILYRKKYGEIVWYNVQPALIIWSNLIVLQFNCKCVLNNLSVSKYSEDVYIVISYLSQVMTLYSPNSADRLLSFTPNLQHLNFKIEYHAVGDIRWERKRERDVSGTIARLWIPTIVIIVLQIKVLIKWYT